MSRTGVIVALVVALALAAAVLLSGKGRTPGARSGPLLGFDPAKVVELKVTRPDGQTDAVCRAGQPGAWNIVQVGRGDAHTWGADAGRIRAALRILSTVEPSQEPGPGS